MDNFLQWKEFSVFILFDVRHDGLLSHNSQSWDSSEQVVHIVLTEMIGRFSVTTHMPTTSARAY